MGFLLVKFEKEKKKTLQNHHLIFVCWPLEHISGPLDVEQDVGEDPNGILVTPHHQVGKTNVVIGGNLALGYARVHALEDSRRAEVRTHRTEMECLEESSQSLKKMDLLVELNVLKNFNGLVIISKQWVKPQESHQAEVTQHLVQGVTAVLSSHALWIPWGADVMLDSSHIEIRHQSTSFNGASPTKRGFICGNQI